MINNAQKYSELRAKLEQVLGQVRRAATKVEARRLGEICSWTNCFRKPEACLLDISHGQGGGGTLS